MTFARRRNHLTTHPRR